MAQTYTYDDFLKALEQSGFGGQFSQADMKLAQKNPDAGMSLLSYKTDWAKATTDEARALANQGAESVRSSYGGYTGGGDGGSFKLDPMSPGQFGYGAAPTFEDKWEGRISDALEKSMDREPYSYGGSAPEYQNRYDPQIQQALTGILDREAFSYDPKTDPVYSAYQKQYAREGQRATANAMGEAAALTGGMPSSWAMTAASQAGDYYASQMADKIPELYQDAYNRYLQEYQMKLSDLSALRGLESDDYNKYRDQLSQYNKDRDFDYAAWLDSIKLGQQDIENLRALRSDDMDLYKTLLGQYNTDREFGYNQMLDEISAQRTRELDAWDQAETAAKYGDYARLNAKGVDTSSAEYADLVARGVQAAEYGDYSLLNQAGIDTSTAQFKEKLAIAQQRAAVGDYSGYASLGIDTSNAELMDALDRQYKQAQIANIYAGMPTEEERALDLEYRRAQIAKLLAGDSGTSSGGTGTSASSGNPTGGILSDAEWEYFNSLSASGKKAFAKDAHALGDDRYYTVLGIKFPGDGGEEPMITGLSDLTGADGLFEYIRKEKEAGNPDYDTQQKVKAAVMSMPGYDRATMDEYLKDFLAELFGKKKTTQQNTSNGTGNRKNQTISAT